MCESEQEAAARAGLLTESNCGIEERELDAGGLNRRG